MQNTSELRRFVGPEFVTGVGALELVGRFARNLGCGHVLLVSDPGVAAAGWMEAAARSLSAEGIAWAPFVDVRPNPREVDVMAGADAYHAAGCDGIVVVGGGSPIDCAKGIGVVVVTGRHILEFEGVERVPSALPPLVCVPTTAGSSADVSQFAIIGDSARRLKVALVSKALVPDASLLDPRVLTTMDAALTAATGMDALCHAIEAYGSNAASPVTDLYALEAVRLLREAISTSVARPLDLEARSASMLASLYAGLAFSNASLGAVHAMAHALGGLADLPHGECNAVLLPYVVGFNYEAAPERYDAVAAAFGVALDGLAAPARRDALVRAIASLGESLGATFSLRDRGVARDAIPALASAALRDPCMATNPRVPTQAEIEALYEAAY